MVTNTPKPSLVELTKNLPGAAAKTAQSRVKNLGKSIVKAPKNLAMKGVMIAHNAISTEIPEAGAALSFIAGIGAEIHARASGKKLKGQAGPAGNVVNFPGNPGSTNAAGPPGPSTPGSPEMLAFLKSIDAGVKIISREALGIHAELRTLSSITSKVWDVSKKSLAATRQGNMQQLQLEKANSFKLQEDEDAPKDAKDLSIKGADKALNDKGGAGSIKKIAAGVAEAIVGEKAGALGLKRLPGLFKKMSSFFNPSKDEKNFKLLKNYQKVSEADQKRVAHFEKLLKNPHKETKDLEFHKKFFGDKLEEAKKTASSSAKDVEELKGKISPALLKDSKLASEAELAGKGIRAALSDNIVSGVVISAVVGAVKGAFKSNLFKNFGSIMDSVEKTFKHKTFVAAVVDFFEKAKVGDLLTQMVIGAGKELFDVFNNIGGFLVKQIVSVVQMAFHALASAIISHMPLMSQETKDKLLKKIDNISGDQAQENTSDWIDKAVDQGGKTVDKGFDKAANALAAAPSTDTDSTAPVMTPTPSSNTMNAAAIHQGSQQTSKAQDAATFNNLPSASNRPPALPPSVVSAPTTNINNTSISNSSQRGMRPLDMFIFP